MDRKEFAECMAVLESSSGHKFAQEDLVVWYGLLSHNSIEALQAAVMRVGQEFTGGFPSPGLINRYADEFANGVELTHGEAFELVVKAIRCFGSYQPTEGMASLPPLVQSAVRACGGFMKLCDLPANDHTTVAAQFRMAYEAKKKQQDTQRLLPEQFRPRLKSDDFQKKLTNNINNIGAINE